MTYADTLTAPVTAPATETLATVETRASSSTPTGWIATSLG
ncbi:hypothetical protein ACVOMT_15030 [Sphingomonas panni]